MGRVKMHEGGGYEIEERVYRDRAGRERLWRLLLFPPWYPFLIAIGLMLIAFASRSPVIALLSCLPANALLVVASLLMRRRRAIQVSRRGLTVLRNAGPSDVFPWAAVRAVDRHHEGAAITTVDGELRIGASVQDW